MYKAMTVDFLVEPATLEEMSESTEVKPPICTETLETTRMVSSRSIHLRHERTSSNR
jgi:hypothetical protein